MHLLIDLRDAGGIPQLVQNRLRRGGYLAATVGYACGEEVQEGI